MSSEGQIINKTSVVAPKGVSLNGNVQSIPNNRVDLKGFFFQKENLLYHHIMSKCRLFHKLQYL